MQKVQLYQYPEGSNTEPHNWDYNRMIPPGWIPLQFTNALATWQTESSYVNPANTSQVIESPDDSHAAVACILDATLGKQTKLSWMSRRPSNFQISIEIIS